MTYHVVADVGTFPLDVCHGEGTDLASYGALDGRSLASLAGLRRAAEILELAGSGDDDAPEILKPGDDVVLPRVPPVRAFVQRGMVPVLRRFDEPFEADVACDRS